MPSQPPIFITCYIDPDLDGFASAIAYAEFLNKGGQTAVPAIFGTPHIEAKYLMERFGFKYPDRIESLKDAKEIILVDASLIDGIDGSIDPNKVIEIIDHRKINDAAKFKNARVQIELIGAAATLVAERFFEAKREISKEAAALLYGAIISNTLNFQSPLTSDRDHLMAKWLNSKINLPETFALEMFQAKSDLSGNRLSETIRGDYSRLDLGTTVICIAQIEMVGAKNLIEARKADILAELAWLTKEHSFKFTFLSIIDLAEKCNYFVTDDREAQEILNKVLGLRFADNVAVRQGLIMRKQIIPMIKEVYK